MKPPIHFLPPPLAVTAKQDSAGMAWNQVRYGSGLHLDCMLESVPTSSDSSLVSS